MKGIVFSLLLLTVLLGCTNSSELGDQKPNIIFFLVDDMGWQETSEPFYTEKTQLNEVYHTPNMEKLSDMGVKFTQAYATAVCSPTRISLMTGMNAARHKVTNWTLRRDISPDPKHDKLELPSWNVNGLSPSDSISRTIVTPTLPQLLKENGYATIHVGKAHFGARNTPGENPLNVGFDINIAGHAAGGPGSYQGHLNYSAVWRNGSDMWDVPGLNKYHGTDTYLTEALTKEALNVLDSVKKTDKPFYLYMSHYAIHAPWEADSAYYGKYKAKGLSDFQATYASMVESMDNSLGEIMSYLNENGLAENTIILFMSDNGSPKQAERNLPLRGHKLTPYEGGIRVPFIAFWPNVTRAGAVSETPFIIEDIFPTILEMAGSEESVYSNKYTDGISIVDDIKSGKTRERKEPMIWHFPHFYDQYPYSVIRKGNHKLIYKYYDKSFELYNIATDISEEKNLIETERKIAETLKSELYTYLKSVDAQTPIEKETGKPLSLPGK